MSGTHTADTPDSTGADRADGDARAPAQAPAASEAGRPLEPSATGPVPTTAEPAPAPAGMNGSDAVNPFLSHLQSLRELQITLSQEGRAESILSEGTTGTVEIVGADCAVAVVEPSNGQPTLRFGWLEGRPMAQHEIAMVLRRLEEPIQRVRSGKVSRVVLGAPEDPDTA